MHEENVPLQAGESLNPVNASESNLFDFKPAEDAHVETATPDDAMPKDAMPKDAMPEDATSEDATSEDTLPKDALPEDALPEDTAPEDTAPEDTAPEDALPEDTTPEDTTPEVATPEVATPEVAKPEVAKPEVTKPEVTKPEEATPKDMVPEELSAGVTSFEEITCENTVKQLTRTEERIRKVTDSGEIRLSKFRKFSDIAINGIRAFVEIGLALKEIRVHDLFKEDGHKSWTAYCPQVLSISKSYADRIILSAQIATHLEKQNVEGIAPELMIPRAESQVRPIGKVPKEFWVVVWCQAIGIAGGVPTQKDVAFVVEKMFGPTGKTSPKDPSLKDIVKDVVIRFRLVLEEGCSKKELEDLVVELEEAVKVRLKVANPESLT